MKHSTHEGVEIDVCSACEGIWLDEGELVTILKLQEKKYSSEEIEKAVTAAFKGVPLAEQESKEHCPKCKSEMTAVNYLVDSGVIIDRCPNAHGVFFDGAELGQVEARHEYWQAELKKRRTEWTKLADDVRAEDATKVKATMGPVSYVAFSVFSRLAKSR